MTPHDLAERLRKHAEWRDDEIHRAYLSHYINMDEATSDPLALDLRAAADALDQMDRQAEAARAAFDRGPMAKAGEAISVTYTPIPPDTQREISDALKLGRKTGARTGPQAMTWPERIDNYRRETGFPDSLFLGSDGRVVGTWIMGNNYRVKSSYYGGYPAGYLRRIRALFPDKRRVLHLFSGRVDLSALPGATVDVNPSLSPDYVDDAQTLASVPLQQFDLVLADPPYSVEDCDHYQTTMVKRNLVMRALGKRLTEGSHVVWLDQVLPMYRKDQFSLAGVIGMVKSTNNRFRVVSVFERQGCGAWDAKEGEGAGR